MSINIRMSISMGINFSLKTNIALVLVVVVVVVVVVAAAAAVAAAAVVAAAAATVVVIILLPLGFLGSQLESTILPQWRRQPAEGADQSESFLDLPHLSEQGCWLLANGSGLRVGGLFFWQRPGLGLRVGDSDLGGRGLVAVFADWGLAFVLLFAHSLCCCKATE